MLHTQLHTARVRVVAVVAAEEQLPLRIWHLAHLCIHAAACTCTCAYMCVFVQSCACVGTQERHSVGPSCCAQGGGAVELGACAPGSDPAGLGGSRLRSQGVWGPSRMPASYPLAVPGPPTTARHAPLPPHQMHACAAPPSPPQSRPCTLQAGTAPALQAKPGPRPTPGSRPTSASASTASRSSAGASTSSGSAISPSRIGHACWPSACGGATPSVGTCTDSREAEDVLLVAWPTSDRNGADGVPMEARPVACARQRQAP